MTLSTSCGEVEYLHTSTRSLFGYIRSVLLGFRVTLPEHCDKTPKDIVRGTSFPRAIAGLLISFMLMA